MQGVAERTVVLGASLALARGRLVKKVIGLVSLLVIGGRVAMRSCNAPAPGEIQVSPWGTAYGQKIGEYWDATDRIEARYVAVKKKNLPKENYLPIEAAFLARCRETQKLTATTIREMDELGTPPPDGRTLSRLMRQLLKLKLNTARDIGEAAAARDMDRFDVIAKKADPAISSLEDEVREEMKRLDARVQAAKRGEFVP